MKRLLLLAMLVALALGIISIFAGCRQNSGTSGTADRPVTLEWFVAWDFDNASFDPVNNEFDKYVSENVNVNLVRSSGDLEKLRALIATNTLPDIVTFDAVSSERVEMEDNGLLLPL
ncbi:MAG: hypothetical protein LBQ88_10030, partial [Treponema sp.]|nr:hypothetical protein [Treponema sp.]